MNENNHTKTIPVHQLTSSPFLIFPIESIDDETFDGVHRHDFYELIWFTDPTENVEIDFRSYQLKANDICLLIPGQVFRMLKTTQRGYVMAFAKDLFNMLIGDQPLYTVYNSPTRLDADSLLANQQLLGLILEEYSHRKRMVLLKAYLSAFLFHVLAATDQEQSTGDNRVHKLFQLIELHYLQHREAAFYAECLHISAKHLNSLVKKERGVTVKELILQRIVLEAKREIHFDVLTLKEIGFKLGFHDPAYFSRFFKTQTGVSAEQFKSSLHKL